MQGRAVRRTLVGVCAAAALLVLGTGSASAQNFFHGIAFTKGCDSPTSIGQPYNCSYQILNLADTAHDTLTVTGLSDQVHAFTGDVNSGNILGSLELVFSGPAVTCVGGSGAGTAASPYVGATSCTLPFGTSITTNAHSFYTVQAADFGLAAHTLTDTATLNWSDLCDVGPGPPTGNCTTGPQTATAGSSSAVLQLPSSTATQIHNGQHQVVTTVDVGTTVHDFVTVTGQPGAPVPTGNVNVDWFVNGDCSGNPAQSSGPVGPLVNGQFDAAAFAFTVNTAAPRAFRANYLGDATYAPSTGACEPLQVVDANIQITPATAFNEVGTNHTLTGHVNVNAGLGGGFVNAPDGTVITFTFVSGSPPASFVGPSTCTTAGGTGSCTVVITSPTPVVANVHAATDVSVGGIVVHRETDGLGLNSGNAVKQFEDANIQISPLQATNEVRTNHTLTLHVNVNDGTGFVNAPAGTVINASLTNANGASAAFVGPSSCTTVGATGSCTVVISSPTAGTTTIHGTTTVIVNGVSLTRSTGDGLPGDSPDANKTWVDANIQISPLQATNAVGTNHTLTLHVNVNPGTGFVNAPDGTVINASLTNSNGATAAFVGPSSCTTAGGTGSCTVVINSPTGGTTTIHGTTTVSVGGVSLTRATGDGLPGDSPDAVKNWASARISIAPSATNEVGVSHTFTVTLEKDTGGGFVPAAGETVTVTCTAANGAAPTPPNPPSGTTNAAGQFTFTVNSPTAGTDTCNATSTLTINGATITVSTNGSGGNSGPATKTWVDANIQITPAQATNTIGTNHTLTGHVNVNAGNGAGFVNAPDGTVITFSLTNQAGATAAFVGPSSCTTAGGTGSCTVVISSPTAGNTNIHASTTVSVGGVSLTRATGDAHPGDSPDANKIWIAPDANIQISPLQASNEIGTNHTLTGHVNVSTDGVTFTNAPAGTVINFTVTNANGATAAFVGPSSCTTVGATGSCTVVISSPTPGSTTIHAATDVTVSGVTLHRETNGVAPNSGDANKNWVDANIQISPLQATNIVGTNHTLTLHVNVNPGTGFVNAPDGTVITASLTNAGGATAVFVGPSSCTTAGGTGSCTVVISSPTAGTTTIHATTTVSVGGVSLTRATGDGHPGDSADANKIWIAPDANIQISPLQATNEVGTNHTLTGHVNVNPAGAGFVNAPDGTVITFTKVSGPGNFVGPSTCTTAGGTGSCTVVITSTTPGTTVVHAATDVTVSGVPLHRETDGAGGNSGNANKTWVDANIQITPQTATNPINTNHTLTGHVNVNPGTGFVNAPDGTVINFTLTNAGGATAVFVGPSSCTTAGGTGSCTVVISSPTAGSTMIHASTTVTVAGVSLTRATGDSHPGDSPDARKDWTGGGQITHTNVSCQDVLSGNSLNSLIDAVNYPSSGGRIGQGIEPGKFFFWTQITTTVPNQVVTVTQSNNSTNNAALFQIHQGWQRLYTGDCSSFITGTQINGGTGASFTVPTPGTYIIGIKYDPKSLAGTRVPVPATIKYDFTTSLGGTTGASVLLKPK